MNAILPAAFPSPLLPLHQRQLEAQSAVFRRLDQGITSQLVNLPTGVGKTLLGIHIALQFRKTLFIVHQQELLRQTLKAFNKNAPNIRVGVIWQQTCNHASRITVAMMGSIANRLDQIDPNTFDAVIIDEAHHTLSRTWRTVVEHFRPKLRLGLSATPERADGGDLSHIFDEITYSMSLPEAIEEGFLVRAKALQVQTNLPIRGLKTRKGDFELGALAKTVNTSERNRVILETFEKYAKDRQTVIFCAGTDHARDVAELFCEAGYAAKAVWGEDQERDQKLGDFEGGKYQVITNAMLLTEGWDCVRVNCVVMARPTQSRPLYAQAIGRGLRLWRGGHKPDCLLIDLMDLDPDNRLELVSAWQFFGRKKPRKNLKQPLDLMMDDPSQVEEAVLEVMKNLPPQDRKVSLEYMVEQVKLLEPPPEVVNHFGEEVWHRRPVTPAQFQVLEAHGVDVDSDWTRGTASARIGSLPATERQQVLLLALGYDVIRYAWTRRDAEDAIKVAQAQAKTPNWRLANQLIPHWVKAAFDGPQENTTQQAVALGANGTQA